MRNLFGLLLFLLLAANTWATTTVTGKLETLGTGNATGYVRFWLRGCGGNQPVVNGTAVIAPSQGGVFYIDIPSDSSGNISGTIYSTRDSTGNNGGDISCGGSTTAVWYGMQLYSNGKAGPETPIHAKNGSILNINSVTPISTNPVVTAPTGDNTYLRLDAGNSPVTGALSLNSTLTVGGVLTANNYGGNPTFSGNVAVTGTTTVSGIFTANNYGGNPIFSGNVTQTAGQNIVTAYNVDNVLFVDGNKYSDIAGALAACPAAGCRIYDSRTGTIAVTSNPFGSITTPFWLYLACTTYTTTAQWQVKYSGQHVQGCNGQSTVIQAVSGFASNTTGGPGCVLRIGVTSGSAVDDSRFEDLTVEPLQTDQYSCGLYSDDINELSGARNFVVSGFRQYGIHFKGTSSGDFSLEKLNFNAASTATSSECVFLDGVGDRNAVTDLTCVPSSAGQQAAAIESSSGGTFIYNLHCENVTDCVKFDSGAFGNVIGINGHSNITNAMHFGSSSDGVAENISSGGGTNSILDDNNSVTLTEAVIHFYVVDHVSTKPFWIDSSGFHVSGDSPFSSSPRGTYGAYIGVTTGTSNNIARFTTDKAITITRATADCITAGSGQGTAAVVLVRDSTSSTTAATLTLANSSNTVDSGALTFAAAAGDNIDVQVGTASVGGTAPASCNVTTQYRMQ